MLCWKTIDFSGLFSQLYDGLDNTAEVLGGFSGSSMLGQSLTSTSNHLWLEFFSDQEDTAEGFKLVYSSKSSHTLAFFHTACRNSHTRTSSL